MYFDNQTKKLKIIIFLNLGKKWVEIRYFKKTLSPCTFGIIILLYSSTHVHAYAKTKLIKEKM